MPIAAKRRLQPMLMKKLLRAVGHRLRTRAPRLSALASGELPLRDGSDLFSERPRGAKAIPNVVYQTWLEPRFGRTHLSHLRRFREVNGGYSFRFFDEAAMDAYMAERYGGTPIERIFRNGGWGPLRTDIWRYCVLFDRGGVYCDIGKAIRKPLDALIPSDAGAVIGYERNFSDLPCPPGAQAVLQHCDRYVINWALMFAPGHPLLKRVIDGIVAKYEGVRGRTFANPKDAILRFTGPIHLTECVRAAAADGMLADVYQAGIDFNGEALIELPGSYVRYTQRSTYLAARDRPIVA